MKNPKFEYRNSKQYLNPNIECSKRHSLFGYLNVEQLNLFRISCFGFRALRASAFSLLEVLVAMVIVSIAVVAFGGLMASSVRGIAKLDRFAVANFLGLDELEEVRRIRDSNYVYYLQSPSTRTRAWLNGVQLGSPTTRTKVLNHISYAVTRRVECVNFDGVNCIRARVTATVSADGQNAVNLTDYLLDYLPNSEAF